MVNSQLPGLRLWLIPPDDGVVESVLGIADRPQVTHRGVIQFIRVHASFQLFLGVPFAFELPQYAFDQSASLRDLQLLGEGDLLFLEGLALVGESRSVHEPGDGECGQKSQPE